MNQPPQHRSYPIFINPSELNFFVDSKKTHTQILTLYNPYEFAVKYQVLSNTQGRKYAVIDPKGTIAPQSAVDLIFKHHAPVLTNCNAKDTFLIRMNDARTKEMIGKRYVTARLFAGEPDNSSNESQAFDDVQAGLKRNKPSETISSSTAVKTKQIIIGVWIIVLLLLFLPTVPETNFSSNIPRHLHLSVEVKLVLSFVLGILSMYLFWVQS